MNLKGLSAIAIRIVGDFQVTSRYKENVALVLRLARSVSSVASGRNSWYLALPIATRLFRLLGLIVSLL